MIYQDHCYMIKNWAAECQFFITRAWPYSWGSHPWTTDANGFRHHKLHPGGDMPRCTQPNIPFQHFCISKLKKMTSLNNSLPSFLPERGLYSGERKSLGSLLERFGSNTFLTSTPCSFPPSPPSSLLQSPHCPPQLWKSAEIRSHELKWFFHLCCYTRC